MQQENICGDLQWKQVIMTSETIYEFQWPRKVPWQHCVHYFVVLLTSNPKCNLMTSPSNTWVHPSQCATTSKCHCNFHWNLLKFVETSNPWYLLKDYYMIIYIHIKPFDNFLTQLLKMTKTSQART
jgi:hypothetical protein